MTPRIRKPNPGNKFYIYTKDGGYNDAQGNPRRREKDLTSLPNCVGIYGWFNEIGGQMKYLKKAWYPYAVINAAKAEGLTITQEPTLGGIMVWVGGKDGLGHVAGVGELYSKYSILTVESEYYGLSWTNYNRSFGDGNWRNGCYWMDKSYIYKGCIKNPFIGDDMTKAETEALIKEMTPQIVKEVLAEIKKETEQLPADDWATDAINMCIAKGVMVGYPDGFHPQSEIRREEVAVVEEALTAYLKDLIEIKMKEFLEKV